MNIRQARIYRMLRAGCEHLRSPVGYRYLRSFGPGIRRLGGGAPRKRVVLVIGHMRARTTLLSHILGSHEAICGHAELHQSYIGRWNYYKLHYLLASEPNYDQSRYLVDKVLHSRHRVSARFVNTYRPHIIVISRRPEQTLASMQTWKPADIHELSWYYRSRLENMVSACDRMRYFFLESDELIDDTRTVLTALTRYLGLSTHLTENYTIFSDTGKPFGGDFGKLIRQGRVIRKAEVQATSFLPEREAGDLRRFYERFVERMRTGAVNPTI